MSAEVVLFDLGGVLIRLGGVREFGELIGEPDDERVWARWLSCEWVRRYERGQCTRAEFARGMVDAYALADTPERFLDRFRAWPRGFEPGAREVVEALRSDLRRACLSNTNELHWNEQLGARELARLFPTSFLSHEVGLVKPDPEIYEHVVERLACPAASILFLDDNQINVDGARAVGLDAHRVFGVAETRALLQQRGLLRTAAPAR